MKSRFSGKLLELLNFVTKNFTGLQGEDRLKDCKKLYMIFHYLNDTRSRGFFGACEDVSTTKNVTNIFAKTEDVMSEH